MRSLSGIFVGSIWRAVRTRSAVRVFEASPDDGVEQRSTGASAAALVAARSAASTPLVR